VLHREEAEVGSFSVFSDHNITVDIHVS